MSELDLAITVSELDLDAIQARAEQATEGPWRPWLDDRRRNERTAVVETAWSYMPDGSDTELVADLCWDADAEFIAHARTDVPALIEKIREMQDREKLFRDVIDGKKAEVERLRPLETEAAWLREQLGESMTGYNAQVRHGRTQHERAEAAEAEVERLREEREGLVAVVSQLKMRGIEADGDAIKLRNTLDRIREALAGHPTCDVHDSDEITCGWKRAVKDAQNVLETRHV